MEEHVLNSLVVDHWLCFQAICLAPPKRKSAWGFCYRRGAQGDGGWEVGLAECCCELRQAVVSLSFK